MVEQERKKVAQLPVHSIGHILFWQCAGVAFLLGFCGENNVNLAFLPKMDGVSWGGFRAAERQCAGCVGRSIGCRSKIRADCAQYHCGEDSGE